MVIITAAIALSAVKDLFSSNSNNNNPNNPNTLNTNVAETPIKKDDPNAVPYVSVSDCNACPAPCADQDHPHYPSYLKMDHETPLLNSMKTYTRHVLISTGQDDWAAHIDDDKDSLAPYLQKAITEGQERLKEANGGQDLPRIVLTNSSRPSESWGEPGWQVVILPDQIVVNNVTAEKCDDFFEAFLKPSVGYFADHSQSNSSDLAVEKDQGARRISSNCNATVQKGAMSITAIQSSTQTIVTTTTTTSASSTTTATANTATVSAANESSQKPDSHDHHRHHQNHQHNGSFDDTIDQTRKVTAGKTTFIAHRWKPKAAIMICSHRKRDKRCGVTAAILKKEFIQILRSKDLFGYGDCEDDVEIWLISHIGGHKFAGNVIVHRSEGMAVWYGRVDPCHAQAIVDVTVEKGQVIQELHRGSMLGSFDHSRKIAW
ncbi:hypothetical protein BG011_003302 [Mortierella polycephala]|uniref:Sucrase/ferredoxin-like-domain-containing protein n=1 Tax=Mortierella polycephala TaxID=41804 RepID=A0A9P6UAE0_9FUNG|nr:hypothetical protein BG011_003302 [Mortierella polycephala]